MIRYNINVLYLKHKHECSEYLYENILCSMALFKINKPKTILVVNCRLYRFFASPRCRNQYKICYYIHLVDQYKIYYYIHLVDQNKICYYIHLIGQYKICFYIHLVDVSYFWDYVSNLVNLTITREI